MTKKSVVPGWFYTQSAVIPYRQGPSGLEIMLITTIKRKRWIIPKGVVEPGLTPQDSAVTEAFEEAGVSGSITGADAVGSYQYKKWQGTCTVTVYPLLVTVVHEDWPEAQHRDRQWVTVTEACGLINDQAVCDILTSFADLFNAMVREGDKIT